MFDGLKNLGNVMELMKNAKQLQEKMKSMQDELGKKLVTGDAGGGLVEATVNGRLELIQLKIDRARFNPADVGTLEGLIIAAVRQGQEKAAAMTKAEMQKTAADMGLPPGMLP